MLKRKAVLTQYFLRSFARNASRYIDDAVGFATGLAIVDLQLSSTVTDGILPRRWNFYISQQALVIFEVVAFGLFLRCVSEFLMIERATDLFL